MIDSLGIPRSLGWPLLAAVAASLGLAASAPANVQFNEIARFSLGATNDPEGPSFIGSNPSAVAWSGSQLYVAGFNNTADGSTVGIVEILDAMATGIQETPSFGSVFGQIATPAFLGYTGLATSGDTLAVTYDPGFGQTHTNGLQAFNTVDNSFRWAKQIRGSAGPAFDPGFPGGDPIGIAWTTHGSGRRALQDINSGDDIYALDGASIDPPGGMIWINTNPFPPGIIPRDMDFDPATGDIYVRRSNDVDVATRTGENSTDPESRTFLVDNGANGQNVLGQNLAFLSDTVAGDLIIYNDRPDQDHGGPFEGRMFADVVKVVDKAGNLQTATFQLIGGGLPGPGVGWYDFSFDAATQTLAVLDPWNLNLFIFQVAEPMPGIIGDYNANGVVDAADYTVWRDNLGTTNPLPNDPVGGTIGQEQYDNWRMNFGDAAGAGSSLVAAAVPEPSGLLLLLLAAASLALARRR